MTYWRTARATMGGKQSRGPSNAQDTMRDRINKFFPPGSLLAEPVPALKRANLAQAILDVMARRNRKAAERRFEQQQQHWHGLH